MIFITYQSLDYLTWKNNRYSYLKDMLNLPENSNLYWCISANNMYQAVINTYTVAINQPALFVMFESENFYRVDAIKWNHYVETMDESLLTDDLFVIEHEDAIEYIVTEIPDKRFEVNTTPYELMNLVANENNKYAKSFEKYGSIMIAALKCYPDVDDIERITVAKKENSEYDDTLLKLSKCFLAFKSVWLIPLYLVGLDYLGYEYSETRNIRMFSSISEMCLMASKCSNIFKEYSDAKTLYNRYKDFYEFVYQKVFPMEKIYPNDLCPCGSGKKYKKCCMRDNKVLHKMLISNEVLGNKLNNE